MHARIRAALVWLSVSGLMAQGSRLPAQSSPLGAQLPSGFVPLRPDGNGLPQLQISISLALDDVTVARALQIVAEQARLNLTFDPVLSGLEGRFTAHVPNIGAAPALLRIVERSQLAIGVSPTGQIVVVRRPVAPPTAVATRDSAPVTLPVIAVERAAFPLDVIRVTPGQFSLLGQDLGTMQTMSRQEMRSMPQLAEDVFRAVNKLPGLAADDWSARIFVRGAPEDELLVTLDGLELHEPYHLKDFDAFLSILGTESIGGIDLSTGGFSARYGDRLTGVLDLRSLEPRGDRPHTELGLGITNARAMSDGAFLGGKGAWLVAARRGYFDVVLKAYGADSQSVNYDDVFAKLRYDLTPTQRLTAHVLHAGDLLDIAARGGPGLSSGYQSNYAWLTLESEPGSRARATTVASFGRLTWNRDVGGLSIAPAPAHGLLDHRWYDVGALRQDWTFSLSDRALLRAGAEAKPQAAGFDYVGFGELFTTGGLTPVAGPPDTTRARASPSGASLGVYATQRLELGPVVAEAGLRYDRQTYGVRQGEISPRLGLAWSPRAGTTLRGAWGRYYQAEQLYQLQVTDGLNKFFPAELAEHRVIGLEQRLTGELTARVEVYDRALLRERPKFLNAFGPTFSPAPELLDDRIRVDPASGDARGLELFLRRGGGTGWNWTATYALARAQDVIDGREVPRTIDARHTLTLDAAYRSDDGRWALSAGWLYRSGRPTTPDYFRYDTIGTGGSGGGALVTVSEHLGALNSERLPSYHRTDVRATRTFGIGRGDLAVYCDIFNALRNRNVVGYLYSPNAGRSFLTQRGSFPGVPLVPTVGLSWVF